MKRSIILGAVLGAFVSEGAIAACASPSVQVTDIAGLLSGNTICSGTAPNFNWQEEHHADGTLWDYKKGDGDPVDPRKQVGSWQVSGNTISHSYAQGSASSGPFSFEVWDNGDGTYSFCGATTVDFTVKTGVNVGCP